MPDRSPQTNPDVEQLILNGQLRTELEPYLDEAVMWVDRDNVPTAVENEFLSAMLAWEKAPILPIAKWFRPELKLPPASELSELDLHQLLWKTIRRLFRKRIVLDFTDHLSDRELYNLIRRDILPQPEKKVDAADSYLHWDCADAGNGSTEWLAYYASEHERAEWQAEFGEDLPPRRTPPYPRKLPTRSLD